MCAIPTILYRPFAECASALVCFGLKLYMWSFIHIVNFNFFQKSMLTTLVIYKFKYGLYEALISTVTISLTHLHNYQLATNTRIFHV